MILDKIKIIDKKNILKLIIVTIISIVLIYYSLKDFDSKLFLQSISKANYIFILIAVFILILTIQIRAIRWKYILNKNLQVNDLYSAQLIGYMGNNILPLRFGEFLKSFYLEKKINISRYEAFGSIILERILDLLGVGFLFVILIQSNLFNKVDNLYQNIIIGLIFFSVSALFASFYINKNTKNQFFEKIPKLLNDIIIGFSNIKTSNIFILIALSMVIWINYILVVHLVQLSFGLDLNLNQSILLLLISTVVLSIPAFPGNIGTFEGSVVYTLSLYGITDNFGFGFILHSVSFIPYTLLGLIYFVKERKIIFK